MNHNDRSALVLYGTETGNSLDFAQELGCMTERLHFWTYVSSLDAVELVRKDDNCVKSGLTLLVFFVQVYGRDYRDFYYWTRGPANQCAPILEVPPPSQVAINISRGCLLHNIRSRRHFLSKVRQVGSRLSQMPDYEPGSTGLCEKCISEFLNWVP